jgi:hypothetical protein
MTVHNDQFVDIANRSQEAVTTAVHTWVDTMQSFASKLGGGQSQLLDLQGAVAQYFDLAEKVLANQRDLAQQWASATAKATEAVTEQTERATRSVAAHTATGTDTVVENAAETARVAAQKAAATARAAGDAATT